MNGISRLALVTGASSGLGTEFARQLAANGWNLLLVARRLDRLDSLKAELEARHGVAVRCLAADLADPAGVESVAAAIHAEPSLELLVNNAGFGTLGLYHLTPYARQEEMVRVHVLATMRLTRAALECMIPRDCGAVINVSSVAGFARSKGNVSYCATKGWMNDFTEGLALELESIHSRVSVQALCPGFTWTEFHDTMGANRGKYANSLFMAADFVVAESLRALDHRTLSVIPGWKYRWFVAVWTKLPARWRMALQRKSPHKRT